MLADGAVAREVQQQMALGLLVENAVLLTFGKEPRSLFAHLTTAPIRLGGLGVAPSGNIGAETAIFEPVHGSAPDIAGKGVANPMGAILSAAMMLDYLRLSDDAHRLRNAVYSAIRRGVRTRDIGGRANTHEVTGTIIGEL